MLIGSSGTRLLDGRRRVRGLGCYSSLSLSLSRSFRLLSSPTFLGASTQFGSTFLLWLRMMLVGIWFGLCLGIIFFLLSLHSKLQCEHSNIQSSVRTYHIFIVHHLLHSMITLLVHCWLTQSSLLALGIIFFLPSVCSKFIAERLVCEVEAPRQHACRVRFIMMVLLMACVWWVLVGTHKSVAKSSQK